MLRRTRRSLAPRRRAPRRTPILAGTALAALAAIVSLGGAGAAAAAERTADERLVSRFFSPPEARLGSTVAMTDTVGAVFALLGAPEGGASAGGGVYHFQYLGDVQGWYNHSRSSVAPTGSPQPFAVDAAAGRGYAGLRESDDENAVLTYGFSGFLGFALEDLHPTPVRAVASQADQLALGHPDWSGGRGLVWIFERGDGGLWQLTAGFQGVEPGDRLGSALAAKPGLVVAGAPGAGPNGAAFVYVRGSTWIEWQRLDSPDQYQSDAEFGAALDIDPATNWIAIGSPLLDRVFPVLRTNVGGVYLYRNVGFGWEVDRLLRPFGAASGDRFGTSVAMNGVVLVAGAPGEDGAEGDEGAAYVYQRSGSEWSASPRLRLRTPPARSTTRSAPASRRASGASWWARRTTTATASTTRARRSSTGMW